MNIHWAADVGDDWDEVRNELETAFRMARDSARAGESFVFIVNAGDLLGRRGPGKAMVATGLLSAARTAALEGWSKGWTANVIAWDGVEEDRGRVQGWAERMLDSEGVTGELIRIGPGHVGKALP